MSEVEQVGGEEFDLSEAVDAATTLASEQPKIPSLSLTLQHFIKTHEGQSLIQSQDPFILGGKVYQGFNGTVVEVRDSQITDQEIDDAFDQDGTSRQVKNRRKAAALSRRISKDSELAERKIKRDEQRLRQLQLERLEKEMGESAESTSRAMPSEPPPAVQVIAAADSPAMGKCDHCDRIQPGDDEKHPEVWKWLHHRTCKKAKEARKAAHAS